MQLVSDSEEGGMECIMKSKKYVYDWDDFNENQKDAVTMAKDIISDPE